MVVATRNQVEQDSFFEPAMEEAPFWESGRYFFVVQDIAKGDPHPEYGVNNIWTFEVYWDQDREPVRLQENGLDPSTLKQFISQKMTSNSRGRPLVEAIIGRKLADGDQVTRDELLGGVFWGLISNEKPKGGDKIKPYLRNPEAYKPNARTRPGRAPVRVAPKEEEIEDLPF